MSRGVWGLILVLVFLGQVRGADDAVLKDRLGKSSAAIKATLKTLRERWDVDHYPNFLASAAMTHSAWELMKVKFQKKILQAHMDGRKSSFVISFMGSSVTAGHGKLGAWGGMSLQGFGGSPTSLASLPAMSSI